MRYNILFLILLLSCILAPASAFAGEEDAVGTPVMSPGLNAYVYELGEKKYKAFFNTGVMNASFQKAYLILGGSFYISALSVFDTGFYANFSLGGRNQNIITSGIDLRIHFVPFWLLEILYVKFGMGFTRYHSEALIGRGMEIPYGVGMEIATGQRTVFNLEYVRRPVYFTDGPSVWDLMLSLGYAW